MPWPAAWEHLGELRLEDAELVAPGIAEYPEVVAALLLVVPSRRAESFQPANFGLDVVGFEVEVHAFLVVLRNTRVLKQDADLGVGYPEPAVDVPAGGSEGLLSLRYTGNTLSMHTGASLRELMARAGHSSSQAALGYLHAVEERNRAIADGLSELVKKTRKEVEKKKRQERRKRDAG